MFRNVFGQYGQGLFEGLACITNICFFMLLLLDAHLPQRLHLNSIRPSPRLIGLKKRRTSSSSMLWSSLSPSVTGCSLVGNFVKSQQIWIWIDNGHLFFEWDQQSRRIQQPLKIALFCRLISNTLEDVSGGSTGNGRLWHTADRVRWLDECALTLYVLSSYFFFLLYNCKPSTWNHLLLDTWNPPCLCLDQVSLKKFNFFRTAGMVNFIQAKYFFLIETGSNFKMRSNYLTYKPIYF